MHGLVCRQASCGECWRGSQRDLPTNLHFFVLLTMRTVGPARTHSARTQRAYAWQIDWTQTSYSATQSLGGNVHYGCWPFKLKQGRLARFFCKSTAFIVLLIQPFSLGCPPKGVPRVASDTDLSLRTSLSRKSAASSINCVA